MSAGCSISNGFIGAKLLYCGHMSAHCLAPGVTTPPVHCFCAFAKIDAIVTIEPPFDSLQEVLSHASIVKEGCVSKKDKIMINL